MRYKFTATKMIILKKTNNNCQAENEEIISSYTAGENAK